MNVRFESAPERKFAGFAERMSFTSDRTRELWSAFMPLRHQLSNIIGTELYSIEVYPSGYFDRFHAASEFQKWAAVEVSDLAAVPTEFNTIVVPAGLYAVFVHRGTAAEAVNTYGYIFQTWLPSSEYSLDSRPHLAVMGEKYKNGHKDSEEDIWIPVTPR